MIGQNCSEYTFNKGGVSMNNLILTKEQEQKVTDSVKVGVIKQLYKEGLLSNLQFEELMKRYVEGGKYTNER